MKPFLVAFGLIALLATPVSADIVGPIGPIAAQRIQTPNSDDYGIFRGFILVGDSIGGYLRYNWGGSYCPGLNFTDAEVQALQRGMNNPRVLVEPSYKIGQGGNFCLVAFSLVLRSDQAALP